MQRYAPRKTPGRTAGETTPPLADTPATEPAPDQTQSASAEISSSKRRPGRWTPAIWLFAGHVIWFAIAAYGTNVAYSTAKLECSPPITNVVHK